MSVLILEFYFLHSVTLLSLSFYHLKHYFLFVSFRLPFHIAEKGTKKQDLRLYVYGQRLSSVGLPARQFGEHFSNALINSAVIMGRFFSTQEFSSFLPRRYNLARSILQVE